MAKTKSRAKRVSEEVRERAVRMVLEHGERYASQWEAIRSIAGKIGCSAASLRNWVRRVEIDSGRRGGVTSEILRKASAYFAQAEQGRRPR